MATFPVIHNVQLTVLSIIIILYFSVVPQCAATVQYAYIQVYSYLGDMGC